MSTVKLTAEQIAEQQLTASIRLFQKGQYVCAITLAGAAEEILGKRLRKLGAEPSFDNLKDSIVRIAKLHGDNDPKTEKLVAELLNSTRNELKHYAGDEALEFDLREDAIELLERAISNYMLLTGVILDEMAQFWSEVDNT